MSRTIAIGDMHGCATALQTLLDRMQPTSDDTIVGLGDYVDRGMESARTIDILIELVTHTRLIPLIGNHELMMYQGLFHGQDDFKFWFQHGGNATLASYGGKPEQIPPPHISFLSQCIRFFETDTHFFVHANYEPGLPLAEQPDEILFWRHIRPVAPPPHANGKIAVLGHTPQPDGDILNLGHLICLDTYCYGDQWMSALDVDSGQFWQANNRGQIREGQLQAPATN